MSSMPLSVSDVGVDAAVPARDYRTASSARDGTSRGVSFGPARATKSRERAANRAILTNRRSEELLTMTTMSESTQTAVLGGGCFWCLEAVFDQLAGVQSVESGYAGGRGANPSYEAVCTGATGHAEVVRIRFDPAVLSFRDLLRVFFSIHDPTTRDRQGNDIGTQYRSVIFCQTPEQQSDAQAVIAELTAEEIWPAPIVTEIAGAATFYPAESYHQEYFERNGRQPYCQAVVAPKVAKFRKQYVDRLKR
jgi:peptide-methionine (S)-S-oxide reductase